MKKKPKIKEKTEKKLPPKSRCLLRRRAPHGPVARVDQGSPVRCVGALPALRHLERRPEVGLGAPRQRDEVDDVRVARASRGDELPHVLAAALVCNGHGLLEDVEGRAVHGLDLLGVFLLFFGVLDFLVCGFVFLCACEGREREKGLGQRKREGVSRAKKRKRDVGLICSLFLVFFYIGTEDGGGTKGKKKADNEKKAKKKKKRIRAAAKLLSSDRGE